MYWCSYFLYSISHPDKYGKPLFDLSTDPEASIPPTTLSAPTQISIKRIITKTFTRYRCDVIITNRLRSAFTAKLWRMGKALQSLGGTRRSLLIENWKSTKWMLELVADEIISKKRKSHNAIMINEREKVRKLEQDLKESNKRLQDVTNQMDMLKKSAKKLTNPSSSVASSSSRGRKKKSWSECSGQYQRRRRTEIAKSVCTALTTVEDDVFKPSRVELVNNETKEVLVVDENGKNTIQKPQAECEQGTTIETTLYIKEKYNISNKAYHELSMVNKDMPRSCTLMKFANELDAHSQIKLTPGQACGVQQSLTERLKSG